MMIESWWLQALDSQNPDRALQVVSSEMAWILISQARELEHFALGLTQS